jgi:hypothetical protein
VYLRKMREARTRSVRNCELPHMMNINIFSNWVRIRKGAMPKKKKKKKKK